MAGEEIPGTPLYEILLGWVGHRSVVMVGLVKELDQHK